MPDHAALAELASGQGGAFTTRQAKACGWTHHAVLRAVEEKRWTRLHPGVLVESAWWAHLGRREQHLAALHGRLLALPAGWYAARRTAALVHGLPLIGDPPAVPQLVRERTAPTLRGCSRHERVSSLPAVERDERAGVPLTSIARTVVDLAREECFRNAVVVADAALRSGVSRAELTDVATRCAGWPGGTRPARVIDFADARSETPLESISRVAFDELRLEIPELQVEVWDGGELVGRADYLWRAHNVIGESDGRAKYATVEDLYREKRREERLRDLGFEVVRWDWATAWRPEAGFGAVLGRAFRRGALNTLAPGVVLRGT